MNDKLRCWIKSWFVFNNEPFSPHMNIHNNIPLFYSFIFFWSFLSYISYYSDVIFIFVGSPRINRIEFTIPSTVAMKDKDMLNITAHIIAFPKPEMYWQFGHVNVSSGITNSFSINRHSSSLVKSNLTQDDFGTYSVYAYNDVGNTNYLLHSVVVVRASKYIIN